MTRVRGAGTFAGARRSGALWLEASPAFRWSAAVLSVQVLMAWPASQ